MITHVVMWRVKDPSQENLLQIKETLLSMQGKIPEMLSIKVGININSSEAAFDLVLINTFADRQALQIYQDHQEHVNVKSYLKNKTSDRAVVDFEEQP